jgi:hypothetical protein
MSTDGVRFAHCVSEGSSLRLRGEESGAKAGAFAYAGKRGKGWSLRLPRGRERGKGWSLCLRGEREAKAGAFAYAGEREAKAGAFAYTAMQVLLDQLYR